MAERLSFPVLVDEGLGVSQSYGIVNQDDPRVPHPTVVIVDREGTVRFVHLDEDYRRRPSPEILLEALGQIEGDEASTEPQ